MSKQGVALCWLTALSLLASAQGGGPQQPTTFRTATARVVVDVNVTDETGAPVLGLTRDQFEIRERGRVQQMTEFQAVRHPPQERAIDLGHPREPSIDVGTNVQAPAESRAFIFVIDEDRINPEYIVLLKRVMAEFLRRLAPTDAAAVTFVRFSNLGEDFTTDVDRLIRAVNNVTAAIGMRAPNLRDTSRVLARAVARVASMPQVRRVVVYVSTSSNLPNPEYEPGMFDFAKRAGVPIYTLDPRGNFAPPAIFETAMHAIALNTGGRAFERYSDLARAVGELMADNSSYYVLGYDPTPYDSDGQFHEIEVRVRAPHVQIRSRPGYVASPTASRSMNAAGVLGGVNPANDLRFQVAALPMIASRRGGETLVVLDAIYPAGPLDEDDRVEVTWETIRDSEGRVGARGKQQAVIPRAEVRNGPVLTMNFVVDLPRGTQVLRVAALSRSRGGGLVALPVDVPDFRRPAVSAIGVGTAGLGAGRAPLALPFPPDTNRRVQTGQTIHVFARTFHLAGLAPHLVLRGAAGEVLAQPMTAVASAEADALDCTASIVIPLVPPGPYTLELTVDTPERTLRRAVRLEIN